MDTIFCFNTFHCHNQFVLDEKISTIAILEIHPFITNRHDLLLLNEQTLLTTCIAGIPGKPIPVNPALEPDVRLMLCHSPVWPYHSHSSRYTFFTARLLYIRRLTKNV